jgi:predicted transcriptional regulator
MVGNEPRWNTARLLPITDDRGFLLGVISRADVLAAVQAAPDASVLDAGVERPVVIHPDDTLAEAADRMILHGVGRLPVGSAATNPGCSDWSAGGKSCWRASTGSMPSGARTTTSICGAGY